MPNQDVGFASPAPENSDPVTPKVPTADQLDLLSTLIATGETPIPDELSEATREALLVRVGQLRRVRLRQFVARVIALDIAGDADFPRKRTP